MAMKIGPYIYGTPSSNVTKHMRDLLITMEKPSHPYHEQIIHKACQSQNFFIIPVKQVRVLQ